MADIFVWPENPSARRVVLPHFVNIIRKKIKL